MKKKICLRTIFQNGTNGERMCNGLKKIEGKFSKMHSGFQTTQCSHADCGCQKASHWITNIYVSCEKFFFQIETSECWDWKIFVIYWPCKTHPHRLLHRFERKRKFWNVIFDFLNLSHIVSFVQFWKWASEVFWKLFLNLVMLLKGMCWTKNTWHIVLGVSLNCCCGSRRRTGKYILPSCFGNMMSAHLGKYQLIAWLCRYGNLAFPVLATLMLTHFLYTLVTGVHVRISVLIKAGTWGKKRLLLLFAASFPVIHVSQCKTVYFAIQLQSISRNIRSHRT